eukprot:Nk52_evm17s2596 gene=Nk52_evmTU17s2596
MRKVKIGGVSCFVFLVLIVCLSGASVVFVCGGKSEEQGSEQQTREEGEHRHSVELKTETGDLCSGREGSSREKVCDRINMMRFMSITGDQGMAEEKMPVPECVEGYLLVKVSAIGVNRFDLLQRYGKYTPPKAINSDILGVEVSGRVVQIGSGGKSGFAEGDLVFGLTGGGGYAEYCLVPIETAAKIPEGLMSEIEAASIPEVWMTAYSALVWDGNVGSAEWILIHAGASAVGLTMVQLAKNFPGPTAGRRKIIVTAGSEEKIQRAKSLGADYGINYKTTPDFDKEIKTLTDGKGVGLLIDFIGGSYFQRNINSMGLDGRMVILGFLGGPVVPLGGESQSQLNIGNILRSRVTIIGSTLRGRDSSFKGKLFKEVMQFLEGQLSAKTNNVQFTVDSVFDFEETLQAHERMASNQSSGKIIIKGPSSQ